MKIRDGFILKDVAGSFVIVPVNESMVDFKFMITLNETGAFLWDNLKSDTTIDELSEKLSLEYAIDKETAKKDVTEFCQMLKEKNVIEE